MAKRYTDTDKWKKKFIRGLQAPYKLLWLYILDECDHAGVWIVDFDVARMRLDEDVFEEEALKAFGEKVIPIDNGERWLVLDFIEFQYGKLNEGNRVHSSVIAILSKYGLWYEDEIKVHVSPLEGAKDKDKEKDKDKDKEKDKGRKFNFKTALVEYGFDGQLAEDWILVRKNKKATNSETAFKGFISEIEKRSCNLNEILKIIIEKSWSGFKWEWVDNLNTSSNGKQTTKANIGINIDTIIASRNYD
jgi:hypothetical protein